MSETLNRLLGVLSLEQLEDGLYRGQTLDLGFGHLFGGQVLGQALSAAKATVASERAVHSFHSYFLRPGDLSRPVVYEVENLRDGGSFSARRVSAIQHGRPIFYMTASFQGDEPGVSHQDPMPQVPGPEGLPNQHDLAQLMGDKLPKGMVERYLDNAAIEMRLVEQVDPFKPKVTEPKRYVWMRTQGQLPDDPRLHRYLLAYASDFNFLVTALQPHGLSWLDRRLKVATIDHAMWYHRPFRFDDWVLYAIDSPNANNSRGLVRGQFFNRDGELIASAVQEGLMRHLGD
ncbi:acyl-CoA thioesterase II [Ferrimonas balearica]|uniref:acyl-CoA thioesterase II n=1 Tax=Ferrimonas balearica TaxID=44012 RepID=UPI001C9941A6|nr:acyl-CoA thioesterase II [Ferrimonas balearica]MBY5990701.1 acyl-CoA thioesterase II [Ferrimonas balearica]